MIPHFPTRFLSGALAAILMTLSLISGVSAQDDELTLIFLGPVAEWLYDRTGEIDPAEIDRLDARYQATLREYRESLPSPHVIAAGRISQGFGLYETTYGGHPGVFLEEAQVEAVIPSPGDLAQGANHLERLAAQLDVPVLVSNIRSSEGEIPGLITAIHIPGLGRLSAALSPESIRAVETLGIERDDTALTAEIASASSPSTIVSWGAPDPAIASVSRSIIIPWLEGHEAAIFRGAQGPAEVVELVPADSSPLLTQPACARLTVADQIPPHRIARIFNRVAPDFTAHNESIRPLREIAGLPSHIENTMGHTYELMSQDRVRTHRLFEVTADPGGGHGRSSLLVVMHEGSGEITLEWFDSPRAGMSFSRFADIVSELVTEHGLGGLPAESPDLLGFEFEYRAVREALEAASLYATSIDELP